MDVNASESEATNAAYFIIDPKSLRPSGDFVLHLSAPFLRDDFSCLWMQVSRAAFPHTAFHAGSGGCKAIKRKPPWV